jgi:hypothetical protein
MKFALCVLALAAVAFAQTPETTFNDVQNPYGNIGYPNRAYGLTKSGANFFGNFYVPASGRPTVVSGGTACMKIILKPDNPTSRTATMVVYARTFTGAPATAPKVTAQDFGLITMSTSTASQTVYSANFPFSTNTTFTDGVSLGGFLTGCTTCVKSADFVITAVVGASATSSCPASGTGITWSPFPIIDSKATWEFDASPSTGYQTGPSGGKFTLASPMDMYLLSIPASSSTSVALAMSNTAGTPPAPSTVTQNGPNLYVSPFGTITRNGEIRSGRIPQVAAGTWWVSPFVNTGSTWSFAVGFGAEPAAAGMLVPSMLLAAILAVVAMLL